MTLIEEESARKYSTGTNVYPYGQAFILDANTGMRVGELIGLKIEDVDLENRIIHIRRNIQSVKKRDKDGKPVKGKEIVQNSTKTYSGKRDLSLNDGALRAVQELMDRNVQSEYLICGKDGNVLPPERIERTFYRVLRNAGIKQTGMHSLRHTFASRLFAKNVDVKTISKLLVLLFEINQRIPSVDFFWSGTTKSQSGFD